jgi:hypothetical protein
VPAKSHDEGDRAVDLVFRPLLARIDIFLGIVVAHDVADHPGKHGIAVVSDLARAHQSIQLLGGLREVGDRLAKFDRDRSLLLQPGCKLSGLPGIVGYFAESEATRNLQEVRLDLSEVDHVAGRQDQPALERPTAVGGVPGVIDRSFG